MLVYELGVPIATQQYTEIIKPGYHTLKLNAVHQKDCERRLVFSDGVEKRILEILRFIRHFFPFQVPLISSSAEFSFFGMR